MAPERLYLKTGVGPKQALDALRPRVMEAGNLHAHGAVAVERMRDGYLQWVEDVEMQLVALTHDADVLSMLQTSRYWHIRDIQAGSARPWPLIEAEAALQKAQLARLLTDLEERAGRLSAAPGHITVLDTNVLLQYKPAAEIPWPTVIGKPVVRLVVPLRVIEELDAKKYSRSDRLAKRARRLLPQLETTLGRAGAPGELRPGVTIEVPVDSGPRRRPTDADEEVLDICVELGQLTGQPVTLLTADTGMRLRAEARGIALARMPDEYARTGE